MSEAEEPDASRREAAETVGLDQALSAFFRPGPRKTQCPVEHLEPGRLVGDFRLVDLIAQGGMGQVWHAEQLSLGNRRVAVKFMRPERVTERQLAFFQREARAGGRLSHPGIVSVHSHGEIDGLVWLAMELVDGAWTLRDYLDQVSRQDALPDDYDRQVARFVLDIARAMQAAHDGGVIHRDLKPQNILITPDNHPKVTDFGLARITDESALSHSGEIAGTYFYMSPEQVGARRARIDHRTDIFSLGVVLYELLALQRPFGGDTSHQVAQQVVTQDPLDPRTIRSRIPQDLAVIASRALEKDRDKRYQTMDELAADLEHFLADEPILARPPTLVHRAVKAIKRNPTKSLAVTVAAVAFSVISGLALRLARQKDDLESERRDLLRANLELELITQEAETSAAAERRRADDVFRLSLSQDCEELMAPAEQLWPAHPDRVEAYERWLSKAEELVGQLPALRARRAELRRDALPRTEEQRRVDRENHAEFRRLESLQREVQSKRAALAVRRGETQVALPSVDWSEYPEDAIGLSPLSWSLVRPDREILGQEALGLVLAERAFEITPGIARVGLGHTLAWARFAVGLDEEALEASAAVREAAAREAAAMGAGVEAHLEQIVKQLAKLEAAVEVARSEDGLSSAEEEVTRLQWECDALEARVDAQGWVFPEEKWRSRWWNNQLTRLIDELESLREPGTGLCTTDGVSPKYGWSIRRRLAFAKRLRAGFGTGGELAARWEKALPAIRDSYPGLDVSVQMGLVPIGMDSHSRRWEFWHVQSGEEPLRGEDGELAMTEASGLVFVLLPESRFWMGAQQDDPAGQNYDPSAQEGEVPIHEVQLSAFFISKFEMTQAQWKRLTGHNPSAFQKAPLSPTLLHPVEQVSWTDCMGLLADSGLTLPSEAQWEYAARAGTDTPWWTGAERESLRKKGAANLADRSAARAGANWPTIEDWPELDDGYMVHAPVGSYAANDFGLHEVHGNVSEWCLDGLDITFYAHIPERDPVRHMGPGRPHVMRGGGFSSRAAVGTSGRRSSFDSAAYNIDLGLRPARPLEP